MTEDRSEASLRAELQNRLDEVADNLRDAEHLDPDARRELAELVAELGRVIDASELSEEQVEHLAETTDHLADALQQQQPHGVLGTARERLEQTVLLTEARAPVLSGITRRLIDALTNIGI